MENIVEYLKEQEDVTFPMLEVGLNMRKQRIEKALDFLENEYAVYTEKVRVSERKSTTYYHRIPRPPGTPRLRPLRELHRQADSS